MPNHQLNVYTKGALEVLMNMSSKILIDGEIKDLTSQYIEKINNLNLNMAKNAMRILAFAYQIIHENELEVFKEKMSQGRAKLIFIGLVGMIDPPRPEVKSAVQLCKQAGIKVIMATGDHKITAEAIGREVGIYEEGTNIFSGEELLKMSDNELDTIINNTTIFARVVPEHKYKIVESLKRKGHVVAMTGDGINDAPALKVADIGISMGITGTEVAKEASDIVLTDDNFSSIVNAVEEGRVIFENVRKVVKYLLCTNIGEILIILIALIILTDTPLIFTAIQILWVNLVTDGVLDITLAMEPKESDVMAYPPRKPNTRIINREIIISMVYVALLMMFGTLFMFSLAWNRDQNLIRAQTIAFITMAMFQVFNSLNCRSRKKSIFELGIFSNKYLFAAITISVLLQIAATTLPFFNQTLGTVSLTPFDWLLIILVSSTVFIGDEIRKLVEKKIKI
jgi:Ca2+-transporting ATPase